MSKHLIFCNTLKQISDCHRYSDDPFAALADFKVILEKARKQTKLELLRNTPGSLGAKLLTASTALRAHRNRHLGFLMHCCEAWEPAGNCIDPYSFECIFFYRLSQIIANLTRERIAELETEIHNLSWKQTEKDNALAKCRLGLRAWCSKKPVPCIHAVADENGQPIENEDESGRRLCDYWEKVFEARVEGERHHCHETILRNVQKAPDEWWEGICSRAWWDPIQYLVCGRIGFSVLVSCVQACARGWRCPRSFCCEQDLFHSQVLRCWRRWSYNEIARRSRCMHPARRCISSRHMTDNIFEIETTALAHVSCALQESGILLTDFAAALAPASSMFSKRQNCPRSSNISCA